MLSSAISRFVRLALPALLLVAGPAAAQQRAVPESKVEVQLSFAPVARQASLAVVNVYGASRAERRRQPDSMEEFFRRYFGENNPSTPRGRSASSVGSGVIVDASGLVVTNNHVIEGMTEVRVALTDRREFEAEIVLRDPRTDLAVLRLRNASDLHILELGDSEALQVGDFVLAIGNPFGVGQTVTHGIVSALARTQVGVSDYQFFIQTDAAINPGNSGGALVDMRARLVGINTAIFSRSGGSHGIGFAIPSTMVRGVIDSARGGSRTVRRPWLGARLQAVTRDIAETMRLERTAGVLVNSIYEGGPAAQAGLKTGDVILTVEGQPVDDPESFGYRFAVKGVGGDATFGVLRNGRTETISVKLITPPETRPREPVKIRTRSPLAGATLLNLSPAVADELQIDIGGEGVVVGEVEEGTVSQRVGFQKGDLVLAINGQRLATTRDAERVVRSGTAPWELTVSRGGRVFNTVVGG